MTQKTSLMMATALCFLLLAVHAPGQQKANRVEQEQARSILRQVEETIEKNYFDPSLRGYDLHARFQEADKKINDAPTLVAALGAINWAVEGLNDSHTFFIPPARNVVVYSGWQMQMVGADCLITAVEQNSDAWKKGLRPGDRLLKVEAYEPTLATFQIIRGRIDEFLQLVEYHLVVASPGQPSRQVTTKSQLITLPQTTNFFTGGDAQHQIQHQREGYRLLTKTRTSEVNDKLMIWKLPQFNVPQIETERLFGTARKHETLILDLRDNGGGAVDVLDAMIGNAFDHDITVGEMIERTGSKPLRASSRGEKAFGGKLIVLVNSSSGSAAEIFARTVQVEKRGAVLGDKTQGAVRISKIFPLRQEGGNIIVYGLQISIAQLKMPDGGDLEGTGVTPDVTVLSTPSDFSEGRDPVLAAAAKLAGVELSAEQAGKMFPVVWATH
jgi:C-terminal processing protease CtpA/Prc